MSRNFQGNNEAFTDCPGRHDAIFTILAVEGENMSKAMAVKPKRGRHLRRFHPLASGIFRLNSFHL